PWMLPYLRREGKERPPFSPTVGQPRSGFPRDRSSRSLYFSTRSVAVLGSASRNSHSRGTWNFASRSAAKARSSSSASGSLATTNALISCPSTGSATPITAASTTRGCSRSVFSISAEGRDGDHAGVGRAEALGHVRDLEAAHHLVADGCGAETQDDPQPARALQRRRLARQEHGEDRSERVEHRRARLMDERPELRGV